MRGKKFQMKVIVLMYKYHKKTGYDWWLKRIAYCFDLYDIVMWLIQYI